MGRHFVLGLVTLLALTPSLFAGHADRVQRLLLLYQKPDGHPPETHEYLAGVRVLNELLRSQPKLEVRLVPADEPWADGPDLLEGADGAVLFLAQGAKWLAADPARQQAFEQLAERRGGLACLHWAMGTKDAEPIDGFTKLFGGCHGGPDRKYKVLETELRPASPLHPVAQGIDAVTVRDEFYYALKWPNRTDRPAPVMEVTIDDVAYPVAWAWERPDGGRSFGFSGLHFHANWSHAAYRRLVLQGVLWSLQREIPAAGLPVEIQVDALKRAR